MARKATVSEDRHREEQRGYRARLLAQDTPEIGRADTAAAVALYAYLRRIKRERRGPQGLADADFILRTAVRVLAEMGCERKDRKAPYDRAASRRVLRRRLARESDRFNGLLEAAADDGGKELREVSIRSPTAHTS
ncbi:hypothetical protein [Tianweitania sediminis]|uniref:Uncharacterized protein n=1 Tax=Tianweitania sediminis TaxID=1502156 RepID=A0A8J7QZW8_9HYPH|nr:hypothetical protein [Tianweitania sediminis]MBP0439898.1 hypothetical protein [Tianweitania sediminis]